VTLTPEQRELGRRNFLRALAGTPALAALGAASGAEGPVLGGPVRVGFIGTGVQARGQLLSNIDSRFTQVVALCDINPAQLELAADVLGEAKLPPAKQYSDWREMLLKERLEAAVIATPLFAHAEMAVGCMEAGLHVLCEKMMAYDAEGCRRMLETSRKTNRHLEIGHQRFYSPVYRAAYEGVVKQGLLGEVYFARLTWHRNGNWRRQGEPPSPEFDPAPWGYPTFEHLLNWRLYWRYSQGLMAELASHMVAVADWFFGASVVAVQMSGGVHRFKDGREVPDHVYATLEYPGGRTAVFTSIASNSLGQRSEAIYGTKGTLVLCREREAYLFEEGGPGVATANEVRGKAGDVVDSSESRPDAGTASGGALSTIGDDRQTSSRLEISGLCATVRTGTPLLCGPTRGINTALACIGANQSMQKGSWIQIKDL